MRRLFSILFCLPLSAFGLSSVEYVINGLPTESTQQSPTLPSGVIGTIISDPQTLDVDFFDKFGETLSNKPSFSVGWDRSNALGAVIWTDNTSPDATQMFAFAIKGISAIELTNLSFSWGSTENGPKKLDVTMDIGNLSTGKATETAVATYNLNTGTGNNPAQTLISENISIGSTTDIIIFRFYAYDAGDTPGLGNNKGGFWDETGSNPISLTLVPEPSWFATGIGILVIAFCLRRRRA